MQADRIRGVWDRTADPGGFEPATCWGSSNLGAAWDKWWGDHRAGPGGAAASLGPDTPALDFGWHP